MGSLEEEEDVNVLIGCEMRLFDCDCVIRGDSSVFVSFFIGWMYGNPVYTFKLVTDITFLRSSAFTAIFEVLEQIMVESST